MTEESQVPDLDRMSYEEAYAALEETLQLLEAGDLPLEQALALYERGAALAQHCARRLDAAELRISQWQDGIEEALPDWRDE